MEKWGATLDGDPCRECGFGWELSPARAVASVQAVPDAYAGGWRRYRPGRRPTCLTAAAYVSHVTDNLRTWAERLAYWLPGLRPRGAGLRSGPAVAGTPLQLTSPWLVPQVAALGARTKCPHRPGM